jgi:hypothetical protein
MEACYSELVLNIPSWLLIVKINSKQDVVTWKADLLVDFQYLKRTCHHLKPQILDKEHKAKLVIHFIIYKDFGSFR